MNPAPAATSSAIGFGWMAWTLETALFFGVIALLLVAMAVWEWRVPGGSPRRGVLRIATTRGDSHPNVRFSLSMAVARPSGFIRRRGLTIY